MDLDRIRVLVKRHWKFEADNYPDLRVLKAAAAVRFERGHILKHIMKSVGRIAEIEEIPDHGEPDPDSKQKMRVLIAKMLVNLIQLAECYDISNDEIESAVHEALSKA